MGATHMQTAIIILLALVCAALLGYITVLNSGLKEARARLKQHLEGETTARLDVPCPNPAAENLLQTVNTLLEVRQAESANYRQMEADLRRQIADVSHDLRTPLTSILGYVQLLEDDTLTPEKRREYLAVVESRALTLRTLITSFYDLSRLEGGQWALEREVLSLERVVQDQLASAYETLERAGLAPKVDIQPGLPPVWGDQKATVRVVSNLLTNALAHGAPPLEIRLYQEGRGAALRVTNSAPHMTAEEVRHVFERFYTADPARSGSTGLGLAIVGALMERMGGSADAFLEAGLFTVQVAWPGVPGMA